MRSMAPAACRQLLLGRSVQFVLIDDARMRVRSNKRVDAVAIKLATPERIRPRRLRIVLIPEIADAGRTESVVESLVRKRQPIVDHCDDRIRRRAAAELHACSE